MAVSPGLAQQPFTPRQEGLRFVHPLAGCPAFGKAGFRLREPSFPCGLRIAWTEAMS